MRAGPFSAVRVSDALFPNDFGEDLLVQVSHPDHLSVCMSVSLWAVG